MLECAFDAHVELQYGNYIKRAKILYIREHSYTRLAYHPFHIIITIQAFQIYLELSVIKWLDIITVAQIPLTKTHEQVCMYHYIIPFSFLAMLINIA